MEDTADYARNERLGEVVRKASKILMLDDEEFVRSVVCRTLEMNWRKQTSSA